MNEIAESFDMFMEMTRREKEDLENKKCNDPEVSYSKEISRLIDETQKSGNKVWLVTDLHLWKYDKDTKRIIKNKKFDTIIENINKTVKPNDMLINLGDLVDGEVRQTKELQATLLKFPGKYRVLIRGNNDLHKSSFYKSCGFDYVTYAFVWNNVVFTHAPYVNNHYDINVHGHIHGSCEYYGDYLPFTNQVDVAWLSGRTTPVEIIEVIESQKKYKKIVTVFPNKTSKDKYQNPKTDVTSEFFTTIMSTDDIYTEFVHDPFDDDGNEVVIQEAAYKNRKLLLTSTGFDNHHIRQTFLDNLNKNPSTVQVLFVPSAANTKEAKDILPACRQELIDTGIRSQNITTYNLDSRMSYEKLSDYDVIYFAGGSEKVLMNAILKVGFKTALKRCINEGLFFIGVSAGAMIATGSVENNLGIIKNPLEPHCNKNITPCGKIINGTTRINLSDNQAVWIHGNTIEIIE